ncbi:hypothetical protein [Paenibacillus tengchongensis]|uniref:hypothetical protein n=1 Tax=Paenibacillus tengchongensis TaxID=2608684 RepID=UPI00124CFB85|nr:hypothetical protein [Paenibacillus tengchongensis]
MYNDKIAKKACGCGGTMTIHMHTLIYSAKIKIKHVPVYTCAVCARYEPLPCIKQDLVAFLGELSAVAAKRRSYSFADRNEWACVLKETLAAGMFPGGTAELEDSIVTAIQAKVDLLLDVYRLAVDMGDRSWMDETERRLSQLTLQTPENADYGGKRKIEG